MSLEGRLEDMGLTDIFQIITLSKRSGILTIIRREGAGRLVFNQGRVTFASSDARGRLGYVMVQKGIITNEQLESALRIQKAHGSRRPIGTFLVEAGALAPPVLERELHDHIVAVIGDFLSWSSGSFYFELGGVVDVDVALSGGFDTEGLVSEAQRINEEGEENKSEDEEENDEPAGREAATPHKESVSARPAGTRPSASAPAGSKKRRDLDLLPLMIAELSRPNTSSELTLLVLRFASEIMNRTVIFLAREDDIVGLGQSGLNLPQGNEQDSIKTVRIPLEGPSVFKTVIEQSASYKGPLAETSWHRYLVDRFGGEWPAEVFVAPLICQNHAIAVLYGDNLPQNGPIAETEGLEAFIKVAEVAFAKALLERKFQDSKSGGP